jgi:hypothetical protein
MSFSNIGYNIYNEAAEILRNNIPDCTVENVYRLPDETDRKDYLGKYNRAVLFYLDNQEKVDQASDCRDYRYSYIVQVIVLSVREDQRDIISLSEEVKYWLFQNQSGATNWYNLEVDSVDYLLTDEQTNIKASEMVVDFYARG